MRRGAAVIVVALVSLSRMNAAEDPHAGHEHMSHEQAEPTGDRWSTQIHGYAFLVANDQDGPSGGQDFESVNHLMVASTHPLWGGSVSVLGTFSVEPLTVPPEGSRLLFQRGETYHGVLLIDHQHPHDGVLQLAAAWERRLSRVVTFRAYLAPVGEPPVGPTAFPHRLSSSAIPTAPLSHHNIDSTHVSTDVVSTAFGFGPVTVEAGGFHGREPGANRFDLDGGRIDSYAGRISVKPIEGLSLQVSAARRSHPEETEIGNQTRQTASIEYEHPLPGGAVGATLAVGRNLLPEGVEERGGLLEGLWTFREHHTVTGRLESVDRDVYELLNKTARPATVAPQSTRIDALTLGYLHDLPWLAEVDLAAGISATGYRFDSILDGTYGRRPFSGQLFLRITLGHHGAAGMHHHH
jgi:hypothetical protein